MKFKRTDYHLLGHSPKLCYFYSFAVHYTKKIDMRRLITSISMIVLAIVFYQCSSKSGKVSVDTNPQN